MLRRLNYSWIYFSKNKNSCIVSHYFFVFVFFDSDGTSLVYLMEN